MATCAQCGSEPETSGLPCSRCGTVLPPRQRQRIRVRKRRRIFTPFYAESGPNWPMIALAIIIAVVLAVWLLWRMNRVERVPPELTGSAAAPTARNDASRAGRVVERGGPFLTIAELGQPRTERA